MKELFVIFACMAVSFGAMVAWNNVAEVSRDDIAAERFAESSREIHWSYSASGHP